MVNSPGRIKEREKSVLWDEYERELNSYVLHRIDIKKLLKLKILLSGVINILFRNKKKC